MYTQYTYITELREKHTWTSIKSSLAGISVRLVSSTRIPTSRRGGFLAVEPGEEGT